MTDGAYGFGAVVALVAYGAVWLSVRGKHPYSGPSGLALGVLYTTLILWVIVVAVVYRRATSGVSGRSSEQQRAAGAAFVTVWAAVYVFQGALYHAGASHAIVYGIYPAAAPLIVLGSSGAAYCAAQENWRMLGLAIAVVALALADDGRAHPGRSRGARQLHRDAARSPRRALVRGPGGCGCGRAHNCVSSGTE